MADLESDFRTFTLAGTGIAAAFGNRYFINHVPDGVSYPYIKATTITDVPNRTHDGNSGGVSLVQLDIYDDDKSGCNAGAGLITACLDNYHGAMGSFRDVRIFVRNVPSNWEPESRVFRRIVEVEIGYV